ncbi:hypothetical protein ACF08M_38775 [Streptomyces sp. NPDC015032]|uniref:hypothetical protein n=1 Tax=Streptomyces sp. NPDC015032 TaxID=3364937 RepID=UPI00370205B1
MTDAIRPEVVTFVHALLSDLIHDTTTIPTDWVHKDGRPMSDHEREVLGSCTRPELQAVQRLSKAHQAFMDQEKIDLDRVEALCAPYFALLPDGAVMGEVIALMPEAERDELVELMDRLTLKDRLGEQPTA